MPVCLQVRDGSLVLEGSEPDGLYGGIDRWADPDEEVGFGVAVVGGEGVDADREVADAGLVEGSAQVGADAVGGHWLAEDLAGAAVESFEVQVEAVHPAVADLHRGEVPVAHCFEQPGFDGLQGYAVQQQKLVHEPSLA